jgi:3-deoxy-7-phosphoheptulonate synthase
MRSSAGQKEIDGVVDRLKREGFKIHLSKGVETTIIGAVGEDSRLSSMAIAVLPGVEKVVPILKPYKLASREFKNEDTIIDINGLTIGGREFQIMAGPCAVESREQILEVAHRVKDGGAKILRGGAFKPRTSPYSFQGLGEEGLKYLAEAKEKTGLLITTEVMDGVSIELVSEYADILQIGARNMQNFPLLKAIAKCEKPVLLKRGPSATFEEWIMAAEYIINGGNNQVILCERGIRTFETYTRNTLDLSAVPVIKHLTHLPVIIDPSHGTGRWELVEAMSLGAMACGADGLMVEVHCNPSEALSDGPQSLTPENFNLLVKKLRGIAPVVERYI